MMRRREFIALTGLIAAISPVGARGQQPVGTKVPIIGFLYAGSPGPFAARLAAFRNGLKQLGYSEGQNVSIEYRWAEGHYDRLPTLAADLVRHDVSVIAAVGTAAPALAAKAATSTIPIVFQVAIDPVANGLVHSFNHPGGNVTGVTRYAVELEAKSLELLRRTVPKAAEFVFLYNPTAPAAETKLKYAQEAAQKFGQRLHTVEASTTQELENAFRALDASQIRALLIGTDSYFNSRSEQLAAFTERYMIPAIYSTREFAVAGGLMSYGASLTESYRQVGLYVGRILRGENPSVLPVQQPTKFDFVVNLKTAKALALKISSDVLSIADEVIE